MVLLDVPFFVNTGDGNRCAQVALQCALKYYLGKDIPVEELDRLTGRKEGKWTSTFQIVAVAWDLGLDVRYYSKSPIEPYTHTEEEIVKYTRETFPNAAETILKHSDLPVMLEKATHLTKLNLFEKRLLSFQEIEKHITQNHLPLLCIDYAKIAIDKSKYPNYSGHFVPMVGFDNESVFYHESGPKNPLANRQVPKKDFIDAWNAEGTDNDVVIVYGKRK